jgi:hypothetical protein
MTKEDSMKRGLLLLVISLLLWPQIASAQISSGAFMIHGKLNWVTATYKSTDRSADGFGLNIGMERVLKNPAWAFGFTVGYMHVDDTIPGAIASEDVLVDGTGIPVLLTVRAMSTSDNIKAYLSAGPGIMISSTESRDINGMVLSSNKDSDFVIGVPAGVMAPLSPNVWIDGSVTLYYTPNSQIIKNTNWFFGLGLVFPLAGAGSN